MSSNVQILVLEGDLSRGLTDLLVEQGYSAIRVADPSRIQSEAAGTALVIVDVSAPEMGWEGWRELSQRAEISLLLIVPGPATEDRSVWVSGAVPHLSRRRLGTRSHRMEVANHDQACVVYLACFQPCDGCWPEITLRCGRTGSMGADRD